MDIQKLINDYTQWLKSEITFSKIGEYYEITTPYLDNANDYLQIYVRQDGNDILFSDDSATISNLKATGFQFTPNRKKHLQRILAQFGVNCEGDELTAKAPIQEFAKKKHLFIQAILRVDDMFALSKQRHCLLMIFSSSLIREIYFIRTMFNLLEHQVLLIAMIFCSKELKHSQSVSVRQ